MDLDTEIARSSAPVSPYNDGPLQFPFKTPPRKGEIFEVAPGILWTRMPLPFQLDHVNVYLIEDGAGWAILDTGVDFPEARATWEALFAGSLSGFVFTKIIVSHYHPDHIGLAGWLCKRLEVPLMTGQVTYLTSSNVLAGSAAKNSEAYKAFYRRHGLTELAAKQASTKGEGYKRMVAPLPSSFHRLVPGQRLQIGRRVFDILSGEGHAVEQIMLHDAEAKILLCADQVLEKISPNISVTSSEPDGDPLGLYLQSLSALEQDMPSETLVLPGHRLPFYGLRQRCRELSGHHELRCGMVMDACRIKPMTVAELVPVLFRRDFDPHQFGFAFSETHAHVNCMIQRGDLAWRERDGLLWVAESSKGQG